MLINVCAGDCCQFDLNGTTQFGQLSEDQNKEKKKKNTQPSSPLLDTVLRDHLGLFAWRTSLKAQLWGTLALSHKLSLLLYIKKRK